MPEPLSTSVRKFRPIREGSLCGWCGEPIEAGARVVLVLYGVLEGDLKGVTGVLDLFHPHCFTGAPH